jgi:hypothetical protein
MLERQQIVRAHSFDLACAQHDIDHRLTKPNHPWTTDEFEQPPSALIVLILSCPRVTA